MPGSHCIWRGSWQAARTSLLIALFLSFDLGARSEECRDSQVHPGAYRLSKAKQGYSLHRQERKKTTNFVVQRAWLEPPGVMEEEADAYVSSLEWSASVTAFSIGQDETIGLHLSSYEIQKGGSAQMAAGRDVFLVLERNGTVHPGLMGLGITKERGRPDSRWFAISHRFLKADINHDGLTDLGVAKTELRDASLDEVSASGATRKIPLVVHEYPLHWYVFDRDTHGWVHKPELDGTQTSEECSEPLPLIEMKLTPVEFVKRIYGLK